MKRLALVLCFAFAVPALSDPTPSAVPPPAAAPAVAPAADPGAPGGSAVPPSPVVIPAGSPINNPVGAFKAFYIACKDGNWTLAAALLLFVLVGAVRMFGKKVHALIPDTNPLDIPFAFLFDTKIGGWVLNWATAIGGCLSMAYMAGMPVDGAAWKTALLASTGGTMLIELKDDVMEWWKARQEKLAAVPAPPKP